MARYALLAVCMVLFTVSSAHAEFYRWVDRSGREFFTNDKEKIPYEYRASATRVEPDESRVSIGNGPTGSLKKARSEGEHKDKYGRGEDYWRKRAAKLYRKKHDLEDEYQVTVKKLEDQDHTTKLSRSRKKKSSLESRKDKLARELAKVRRELEVDLPAEARRADAYPGWIRE